MLESFYLDQHAIACREFSRRDPSIDRGMLCVVSHGARQRRYANIISLTNLSVGRIDFHSLDRRESPLGDVQFLAKKSLEKELSNGRILSVDRNSYTREISHLPEFHRRRLSDRIASAWRLFRSFSFGISIRIPGDPCVQRAGHFNRGCRHSRARNFSRAGKGRPRKVLGRSQNSRGHCCMRPALFYSFGNSPKDTCPLASAAHHPTTL